jgi:hypothetical protein
MRSAPWSNATRDSVFAGCSRRCVKKGEDEDVSIAELAALVRAVVGFEGEIVYDRSRKERGVRPTAVPQLGMKKA